MARSTRPARRRADSRGCSRIERGAAGDRASGGIGGGDRGRIHARCEHRRARLARAALNVGQPAWPAERHRRRCLSVVRGAGGSTAPQRCSRWGDALRQAPPRAARYGQTSLDARAGAVDGRLGRRRRRAATAGASGSALRRRALRRLTSASPTEHGHGHEDSRGRRRRARIRAGGGARRSGHRGGRPETQKSWRRPIFPKGCPLSIFGAGELDFRVRDGNGYGLSARVTRICCVWMCSAAGRARSTCRGAGRRGLIFDLVESQSGTDPDFPATDPWSVAEEVKPSTVSTAQLHPSPDFHMRPI